MAFIKMSLCALMALAVVTVRGQSQPQFCVDREIQCPPFTSQAGTGYELRSYPSTTWVATTVTSDSADLGRRDSRSMFWKLFGYINGQNSASQNIAMTAPVLTSVNDLNNGQFEITMMFYLTSSNPPSPTDSAVSLVTKPAGDYYVKSFTKEGRGWMRNNNNDFASTLNSLKSAINNPSLYDNNVYYKAGYDAPFTAKRYYEVWIEKTA